jgi:hypothetical protein
LLGCLKRFAVQFSKNISQQQLLHNIKLCGRLSTIFSFFEVLSTTT